MHTSFCAVISYAGVDPYIVITTGNCSQKGIWIKLSTFLNVFFFLFFSFVGGGGRLASQPVWHPIIVYIREGRHLRGMILGRTVPLTYKIQTVQWCSGTNCTCSAFPPSRHMFCSVKIIVPNCEWMSNILRNVNESCQFRLYFKRLLNGTHLNSVTGMS